MTNLDHGYAIVQQVFEAADMEQVLQQLDAAGIVRTKAGARHVVSVPAVRELATDPRLLGIAASAVGSNPDRSALATDKAGRLCRARRRRGRPPSTHGALVREDPQ